MTQRGLAARAVDSCYRGGLSCYDQRVPRRKEARKCIHEGCENEARWVPMVYVPVVHESPRRRALVIVPLNLPVCGLHRFSRRLELKILESARFRRALGAALAQRDGWRVEMSRAWVAHERISGA